jgi:hypothetical protein
MGPAPWGTGFAQVLNDLLNKVGPSAPFPSHSSMHSTLPEGPSPPVHSLLLPNGCRLICTDLDHKARSLPPIHPRRPQNTASRSRPTASHTASCSHLASQRPHPSVNMMWSTRLKMENAPALGRLTAAARYKGRSWWAAARAAPRQPLTFASAALAAEVLATPANTGNRPTHTLHCQPASIA